MPTDWRTTMTDLMQCPSEARTMQTRGRPRIGGRYKSFERTKPWLAKGMSRSTWYRRRAERKRKNRRKNEPFTDSVTKSTESLVLYDGKPFGIVVSVDTLSSDQLCEAANNYERDVTPDRTVVRCTDGSLNMVCADSGYYDFVDAVVTHHQDGSFEVIEIVKDESANDGERQ